MISVLLTSASSGFIFSSNMPCLTSPGAKIWTPRLVLCRRIVGFSSSHFSRAQSLCPIAGDSSKDRAGTSPPVWRCPEDRANQRYAVERPETERHHHCAGERGQQREFSRSEKFRHPRRRLVTFFQETCDQGSFTG